MSTITSGGNYKSLYVIILLFGISIASSFACLPTGRRCCCPCAKCASCPKCISCPKCSSSCSGCSISCSGCSSSCSRCSNGGCSSCSSSCGGSIATPPPLPKFGYVPPLPVYAIPPPQYAIPSSQYALPSSSQYIAPKAPAPQYIAPVTATPQYIAPASQYPALQPQNPFRYPFQIPPQFLSPRPQKKPSQPQLFPCKRQPGKLCQYGIRVPLSPTEFTESNLPYGS